MKPILKKLFTGNEKEAYEHIIKEYHRKWYAITHYLYFANVVGKHLFENYHTPIQKEDFQEALKEDYQMISKATIACAYKKALMDWDVLLPDGIALQIFYRMAYKLKRITTPQPRLYNLNGTDFCPFFLDWLQSEKGAENVEIYLYGTYPGILEKTKAVLSEKGYNIVYAQDGFTNFDREQVSKIRKQNAKKYSILLVARSTPEYPIQELWSWSNQDKLKENKFIVFTQAGTFDFWAGIQKRAPKLRRQWHIERLRRLITDPKRNSKKVLDTLSIIKYVFSYLLLKNK